MIGEIIKYRDDLGIGVIAGADGTRFRFSRSDVLSPATILRGLDVDFVTDGRVVRDVVVLRGDPWAVFAAAERA